MAKETIYKAGKLRGSKLLYPDGETGVGIWYPFSVLIEDYSNELDDESNGVSFEVDLTDLDDAITLLTRLRSVKADVVADFDEEE